MGSRRISMSSFTPTGPPDYGGGDLTRFADDMIITARSRAQAELILELLEQFLAARGLKLNWDKTYISKVSMGFEFLSRWYRREDSVLVVRPSDQAVKRFENSWNPLSWATRDPSRL